VEANVMRNTRLGGGGDKEYILHHLILKPKITIADGLTVYSRFDIFNNAMYPNSQVGQVFGDGVGSNDPNNNPYFSSNSDNSSVLSQTGASESVAVTNLYLSYTHEYGNLLIGRIPLHFGLGMTYNAGDGTFDHWLTTRDMIAYKLVYGNLSVMPAFARVSQGSLAYNEHANDYIVQALYENPETDLAMGLMYLIRQANSYANDAPAGVSPTGIPADPNGVLGGPCSVPSGPCPSVQSDFSQQTLNVFVIKDTEHFRFGIEGAFQSGKSGVYDNAGNNISFNGFGIATETEWRPDGSKWKFGAKIGYASGDDPTTTNRFEGYVFNRNYDVALLMFNYPLGQRDFLRSFLYGGGPLDSSQTLDSEAISNVTYLAPYTMYALSDRFTLGGVLATGILNTVPLVGGTSNKNLGYEFDLSLNYKNKGGIIWANTLGLLAPGGAFQGDQNYLVKFAYGLQSKVAVHF
jgi:hypothetical protein